MLMHLSRCRISCSTVYSRLAEVYISCSTVLSYGVASIAAVLGGLLWSTYPKESSYKWRDSHACSLTKPLIVQDSSHHLTSSMHCCTPTMIPLPNTFPFLLNAWNGRYKNQAQTSHVSTLGGTVSTFLASSFDWYKICIQLELGNTCRNISIHIYSQIDPKSSAPYAV